MMLTDKLALLLSACGLCVFVLASGRRAAREGIAMMMELWTAAGLLRLTHHAGWHAITAAAALIVIRKLVLKGLHSSVRADLLAQQRRAHVVSK